MNSLRGVDGWLQFYAEELIAWAASVGFQPRVTSGRRSHALQKKLYEAYRSGRSALPAAPPGKSKHEFGLAVDMIANSPQALESMGKVWQSWGLTWGGKRDPVHFEL
jgi:LAS superfamily LD-carboxypeptidase LdcB